MKFNISSFTLRLLSISFFVPLFSLYNTIPLSSHIWRPEEKNRTFFTHIGISQSADGFNLDKKKVSATQYLDLQQNALAMLKGSQVGSLAHTIAQQCALTDDGYRGRYEVAGKYKQSVQAFFGGRYAIDDEWWIGGYVGVINTSFDNVEWKNQTRAVTAEDIAYENLVGSDFFNQIKSLSNGLSLEKWEKKGWSDMSLWFGWQHEYIQHKEWLKSVTPHIRAGMVLPCGTKKDENKILCIPLGNDGAPGLQIGGGLLLNFLNYVNTGLDVEFMHVFTTTRERRIKTDYNQTESLLLTKTLVSKDPGLKQNFTLFAEVVPHEFVYARIQYNFSKESESKLYPVSNVYSSIIANSAKSLQGSTTHTFTSTIGIQGQEYNILIPNIEMSFSHPFHGKQSLQANQFSLHVAYNF